MKPYIFAIALAAALVSCQQNEPDITAMAKSYKENFIKRFGEINPEQDWNVAEYNYVILHLGDRHVSCAQVTCFINDVPYRLTSQFDLTENVMLPFDMPKYINWLVVDLDGETYVTEPGGTIDPSVGSSRAEGDVIPATDATDMKWLMVCEDLGDSDDFDFNDMIVQFTVPNAMAIKLEANDKPWNVVDNGTVNLNGTGTPNAKPASRALTAQEFSAADKRDHCVVLTALAAGGTQPLFVHYYDGATGTDYIIGPGNPNGYAKTSDLNTDTAADFEWHRWFSGKYNIPVSDSDLHKMMLNTDWNSNKCDNTTIEPNWGDGIQIALPIKDGSTFSEGKGIIDANFTYTTYSVTEPHPTEAYKYKVVNGFYITVRDYLQSTEGYGKYIELGNVIGHPNMGEAPQMFLIPDHGQGTSTAGWLWPQEREGIKAVYPRFADWCNASASDKESIRWSTDYPQGKYHLRTNY